jgi:hypothetical protein
MRPRNVLNNEWYIIDCIVKKRKESEQQRDLDLTIDSLNEDPNLSAALTIH